MAARRDDPTVAFETAKRLLDGESPVRVWREERGLSQRALAERAGVSPSMLNEIEHGRRTPSLTAARALAAALQVTLDDLFGEER
jgi:transcriptional regulator with XRE-family HTH domain